MKKSTLFFLVLYFTTLWAETTLNPAQVLKLTFPASDQIVLEEKTLSTAQQLEIEKKLDEKIKKNWKFYVVKSHGKIEGYGLVDHEIGKTEPITFLTVIRLTGEVKAVEILAYRESFGAEVREERFLRQYQGKNPSSSLRVGRDIASISGATLSARAVTRGVKRAVMVWSALYGHSS